MPFCALKEVLYDNCIMLCMVWTDEACAGPCKLTGTRVQFLPTVWLANQNKGYENKENDQ